MKNVILNQHFIDEYFDKKIVPGDGNCFYTAIGGNIVPARNSIDTRKLFVDYFTANKPAIIQEESFLLNVLSDKIDEVTNQKEQQLLDERLKQIDSGNLNQSCKDEIFNNLINEIQAHYKFVPSVVVAIAAKVLDRSIIMFNGRFDALGNTTAMLYSPSQQNSIKNPIFLIYSNNNHYDYYAVKPNYNMKEVIEKIQQISPTIALEASSSSSITQDVLRQQEIKEASLFQTLQANIQAEEARIRAQQEELDRYFALRLSIEEESIRIQQQQEQQDSSLSKALQETEDFEASISLMQRMQQEERDAELAKCLQEQVETNDREIEEIFADLRPNNVTLHTPGAVTFLLEQQRLKEQEMNDAAIAQILLEEEYRRVNMGGF